MKAFPIPVVLVVLIGSLALPAQETLPPYHWANRYLEYLKVRGYLPELWVINRPYERQEIAQYLLETDWEDAALPAQEREMLRILLREFAPEVRMVEATAGKDGGRLLRRALDMLQAELLPETVSPRIKAGGFAEGQLSRSREAGVALGQGAVHPQLGLFWKNMLTLYHNSRIFNRADSTYIGGEFAGLRAYVEQGYAAFRRPWLRVKFGRDFMQIGPGRTGQLLISDNSRPFDMYSVRLGTRFLQFSFWGFMLNRRSVGNPDFTQFGTVANRYLNGHRVSLNLGNRVFLGVSEVVMYGGPNRGWELGFMNPIGIYYAHNVNVRSEPGGAEGNILLSFDWDLYLFPDWEIYGEFLVDDFQIEKKTVGDLEPNELGLIVGVNWARPLGLVGGLVNVEYVQVRNRTYNVALRDWEKYLHRNRVIGYALGNNFERWQGSVTYWLRPDASLRLVVDLVRQGEGSVAGPFNTDFMNATLEEGYDEPFPFGVVERTFQLGVEGFYRPHPLANITAGVGLIDIGNYRHREGADFSDVTLRASVWVQWSRLWSR